AHPASTPGTFRNGGWFGRSVSIYIARGRVGSERRRCRDSVRALFPSWAPRFRNPTGKHGPGRARNAHRRSRRPTRRISWRPPMPYRSPYGRYRHGPNLQRPWSWKRPLQSSDEMPIPLRHNALLQAVQHLPCKGHPEGTVPLELTKQLSFVPPDTMLPEGHLKNAKLQWSGRPGWRGGYCAKATTASPSLDPSFA